MHNDISLLISGGLHLIEQQSTYNPNMPLRMLQYTGQLFEKYIKLNHLDKYSPRLLSLPGPKLVVFYNGIKPMPDETILSLQDSFTNDSDPDISVKVRLININPGQNSTLLKACRPLQEYSWLIGRIREHRTDLPLTDAINKAIDEMPQSFVIRDLLIAHRAEVNNMLETEYNEEEVLETARKAAEKYGREQGIEIGEARGADMFAALLRKLTPGSEEFYAALNSTAEERKALYAKYGVESGGLSPVTQKKNYMEKFDFSAAMDELEAIAAKVEDPQTGLADIDKYIARSEELISGCREYLRTSREKVENLGK